MRSLKNKKKKIFLILTVVLCVFAAGGGFFVYAIIQDLPRPERITERDIIESTKIFDRTGNTLLYEIHGEERRTLVPFDEIPEHLKQATIAAEDINFYRHIGVDGRGILRALVKNILQGDVKQGGSTITQQLIKNSLLSSERTYTRKIKEAILAIAIEKKYTKEEILGLYLNQIPYGSNAYGISAAAETFFGKKTNEITLAESAVLAALPNAPTRYSPYGSRKDELMERKNWIIDRMAAESFITKEEAESAKSEEIAFQPPRRGIRAPHFVMYIREYLNERFGEESVERGGLRVITTLDWELQQEAEKIVLDGARRNEELVGAKNAALTAIDPRNGEILVMVGSRDYFDLKNDGNVNVTIRPRQPGSAFKPFVYATAFKKGYLPETVLFDVFTEFNPSCNPDGTPGPAISNPRQCYHPRNFDGRFRGPVTLRQALAQSLNIPSVKLLYLAGVRDSIQTARDMGISTIKEPERYGLSLVLGGAEVNLLEMVSAYGVFSQDGILHPKTGILRIENSQGVVLEEKKEIMLPVLDTNVARIMNDLLSDNNARVPMFSPQSALYIPGRQVAAKTGTTQEYRDSWIIGYTPSLVAGVWVGNNDNSEIKQSGASVMVAGPIWNQFMKFALARYPNEKFSPPQREYVAKAALRGHYRSGEIIRIDKISGKLATEHTPPELIEEISIGEVRSILAMVRKENPLGPAPDNPYAEPQFANWQAGIERWLAVNPLAHIAPPTEYDDLHLPEKRPKINFISPSFDETSKQQILEISVQITSSFPLKEVVLSINDVFVHSYTSPIVSDFFVFPLDTPLTKGAHKIKITAFDTVGNREAAERSLEVDDSESH